MKKQFLAIILCLVCLAFNASAFAGAEEEAKPIALFPNAKTESATVAVMAGHEYTLELKADGSLWGWHFDHTDIDPEEGEDAYKPYGFTAPKKIMSNVSQCFVWNCDIMVIKTDGSLLQWRIYPSDKRDTDFYDPKPEKVMTNVASVAFDSNEYIAIKEDGTLCTAGEEHIIMAG